MILREVSFRDAIKPPGSLNGAELVMRSEKYNIAYDEEARMVSISAPGEVVHVPLENVRYMIPMPELPATMTTTMPQQQRRGPRRP